MFLKIKWTKFKYFTGISCRLILNSFSVFCYVPLIRYCSLAMPSNRVEKMLISFNCNETPNFLYVFPKVFYSIWFYRRYSFLYGRSQHTVTLFQQGFEHIITKRPNIVHIKRIKATLTHKYIELFINKSTITSV